MKKVIVTLAFLGLMGIIIYYAASFTMEFTAKQGSDGENVEITIPKGATAKSIAAILKENGVIKYERAFLMKLNGSENKDSLQMGNFQLNTGMTLNQVIAALTAGGDSRQAVTVTFPEGYSVEQMGKALQKAGVCKAKSFYRAANKLDYDFKFVKQIPKDLDVNYRLQGYLYPDTYDFYIGNTGTEVVQKMLENFEAHLPKNIYQEAASQDLSIYQIVTMASMVEKETKISAEKPRIAGVFFNRIRKDMPLQIDATVVYAITDGTYKLSNDEGIVTYNDLETDSLYNTYKYSGLPIGPICNPDSESIAAVLKPETHNYLYYHTTENGDGSHIFSETLAQHTQS